ncbi:MAG: hypothetical protein FWB78_10930 [Treponema sp.]|nr:hypothetical protein [Treponema sp.]
MAFAINSCTTFQVSGIEVAKYDVDMDIVGNFSIVVRVNQFFGLSSCLKYGNRTAHAMDPVISYAINREIDRHGGSRAINVEIEYRTSFSDLLLNHLTLRIWSPARVHITGTVVR